MSTATEVREVLAKKGQATIEQIARELGIAAGDPGYHRINQALAGGQGKWSQRVARGEYVWLGNNGQVVGGKPDAATSAELQPLVDAFAGVEFHSVGLTYVARTQDGAFICTDQHGVAWRVEVTATARLI